ncbi:unnamed protein product [Sphacelaria rigidula]
MAKVENVVVANLDPAGINKKIEGGKMLDPTNHRWIELMHTMLNSLSELVWQPLKNIVEKAVGATLTYLVAFLRARRSNTDALYECAKSSGVTYADIANVCTLLLFSLSFQRSQVLREATITEFMVVPNATHHDFTFKDRKFKTESSSGSPSAPPVSRFMLTPDQSMIMKFIATAGHKLCNLQRLGDEKIRLFVNTKGQSWAQKDISSRFQILGRQWLGIENFGPHVCRSFWASSALNVCQIGSQNLESCGSFPQVSTPFYGTATCLHRQKQRLIQ